MDQKEPSLIDKVKGVLDSILDDSSFKSENESNQSKYYHDFQEQKLKHRNEEFEIYKLERKRRIELQETFSKWAKRVTTISLVFIGICILTTGIWNIICNKDFLPNYVLLGMLGATVGSAISVSLFIIKSLFPTNPLKDLKSQ